jgi:hypothetical protein
VKNFAWRTLVLLAAVPACTLLQPLDNATPDPSGGDTSSGGADAGTGATGGAAHGGSANPAGGTGATGGAPAGAGGPAGGSGGTISVPPRGGAGGVPAGGGAAGAVPPRGGAGGAPAACASTGTGPCSANSDCCQTGAGIVCSGASCLGASCVQQKCYANCNDGAECFYGCCDPTYNVCATASQCGCFAEGASCVDDSECCGGSLAYCDGTCHRLCTAGTDCPSGCCDVSTSFCTAASLCQ